MTGTCPPFRPRRQFFRRHRGEGRDPEVLPARDYGMDSKGRVGLDPGFRRDDGFLFGAGVRDDEGGGFRIAQSGGLV